MSLLSGVARILRQDVARSESVLATRMLLRLFWYCVLLRRLRTLPSEQAFDVTLRHNLKSLGKKLNRMQLLIRPLSVLEQVGKDARVLVIGPRNEWDLFLLHRHGFEFRNCTGLDLISYSPRIVLGDMHAIPFGDGEFDVVLCGWTISYSAEPARACAEIARVCKRGGTIGIGVEYFSGSEAEERAATGGYNIQDQRLSQRINSVEQILALFPAAGARFFSHDAPLRRSVPRDWPPSNCAVIFENA
jgi:SAM-dependent methyltransferase